MTNETKISFALSIVSGFVDTAGYIALFGLFTAHVTGNLVLAGAAFVSSGQFTNLASKLLMLPVFIFGVAFTSYFIKYKKASAVRLVLFQALFITCFAIAGSCLLNNRTDHSGSAISITASFAVIGMAIQNTYMRKLLNNYTPNTVMTGNFTQFSIDLFNLIDYYFTNKSIDSITNFKTIITSFKKVSLVLFGFLAGCLFGALLVNFFGLLCCLLPSVILLWVKIQLNTIK